MAQYGYDASGRPTKKYGESTPDYEKRLRQWQLKSAPVKSPEQLRQEEIYTEETKRLAKEAGMPQLEAYKGIESLAGGGQLTARQLSGADIQREMEASPWLKMAMEKQAAEQSRLLGQGQQQQASQLAQARANLAMRGGLRGGSAERLAMGGAEGGLLAAQNVRGAGAIERGQLGMQGADLASRLAQFNVGQQAEADRINLQAQIANLGAQENRKLQQYGERMKGYAAEKTGQAYSGGGKK